MLKSKTLFTILAITLAFAACKKNTSGANNNNTTGTNTSTADCKACAYEPVCYNATYTFTDSTYSGVSQRSFTYTGVSDTTIQGVIYQKVITTGEVNSYYNCNNGTTTVLAYNAVTPYGTYPVLKATPLKASLAIGTSWTDLETGAGQSTITYVSQIVEKGITRNVLGVNFTNVIHVNVSDSVTDTNPPYENIYFGQGDYYYSSGVGLIDDFFTDQYGDIYEHSVLKTYSIPN